MGKRVGSSRTTLSTQHTRHKRQQEAYQVEASWGAWAFQGHIQEGAWGILEAASEGAPAVEGPELAVAAVAWGLALGAGEGSEGLLVLGQEWGA